LKIGLVLEGGAMRGLYTAGMLDLLMEENILVDGIIGVSAGALIGINYKSKQIGRALRYNKKYCNNKNYLSFYSYLKTGNILNKEFAFNKLVNELDPFDFKTYKKNKVDMYATVTNIETGKAEYHKINDLNNINNMEYLRASGTIPHLSKIVEVNNNKYLDGGIADSIPFKKMKKLGYDKIIVVLTRIEGYTKKRNKLVELLNKVKYKEYPNYIYTANNRYKMYNTEIEELEELEHNKDIFVIRPSRYVDIKRIEHNPSKIEEMYNLGYNDTKNSLKELKKYLEE